MPRQTIEEAISPSMSIVGTSFLHKTTAYINQSTTSHAYMTSPPIMQSFDRKMDQKNLFYRQSKNQRSFSGGSRGRPEK